MPPWLAAVTSRRGARKFVQAGALQVRLAGMAVSPSSLGKLRFLVAAISAAAVLALPAVAQASEEFSVSAQPSASAVPKGGTVTMTVTVANKGTEPPFMGALYVDLSSLSGHGQPAANPVQSIRTSQGSCGAGEATTYQEQICSLGVLAPGATATIVEVIQVNQTMNHMVALLRSPFEGEFADTDRSNNTVFVQVTASTPPLLTGSKKIALAGLPTGCAPGDFTLQVKPQIPNVKKIIVFMDLGFDENGVGQTFEKSTAASRFKVRVPASQINDPQLGATYTLKVKVRRHGAGPLKRFVEFQLC